MPQKVDYDKAKRVTGIAFEDYNMGHEKKEKNNERKKSEKMKTIQEVIDLCVSYYRIQKYKTLEVDKICPLSYARVDLVAVREHITKDLLKSLGGKLSND
jgi:hypothetical protein